MQVSNKIRDGIGRLTKDVKTVAITCLQWGDTGKGKFVDLFADWAKYIVRGTGGDNAGHSIHTGEEEYVFHIVPSGILYDGAGKFNVIGSGTVVNPKTLIHELSLLDKAGLSYEKLLLSSNAKLILPTQIVADRVKEAAAKAGKIGTTGRGIGPTYADFYARQGLVVNDLLNKDTFVAKLRRHLATKRQELCAYDPQVIKDVMSHPSLDAGLYYSSGDMFDEEAIVETYLAYGQKLNPFIRDTEGLIGFVAGKENILLEGAQGVLLSVDYGSYPFVTSSDCSAWGLAKGAGLSPAQIDLSLGIAKGFYMTRVGEGPFPTELGGEKSADWCSRMKRHDEEDAYGDVTVNDSDDFRQGVALRRVGNEYGATTGRPRRTGWLDLPLLRHAMKFSGRNVILTKLDVLNACQTIKVCLGYSYDGPNYRYGNLTLKTGYGFSHAVVNAEVLQHCRPVYREFPGWECELAGSCLEDLPINFRKIYSFVTKSVGINPRIISIGRDREQTIFV